MNLNKIILLITSINKIVNQTQTAKGKSIWSIKTLLVIVSVVVSFFAGQSTGSLTNLGNEYKKTASSKMSGTNLSTTSAPISPQEEFGFSPEGSAKMLVLKFVNSSTKTLDIMAYSFTSPDITDAMIQAHQRGVVVRVVVDKKANVSEESSDAAKRALNRLIEAGIAVKTIGIYQIHHDKVMIADGKHLENGSFNFSNAADNRNSENVSVRWNNPKAADIYTKHFLSRFERGEVFKGIEIPVKPAKTTNTTKFMEWFD